MSDRPSTAGPLARSRPPGPAILNHGTPVLGQGLRATSIHPKTIILTVVVILSNTIGNFSLRWGMRKTGPGVLQSPLGYIEALFNPWVAIGVCLLLLWMLSQMVLLSWADLSYVLPVTAAGYVLAAIAGRIFLDERISMARWSGVVLIMAGVVLVGRTQHSTTGEADR